MTERRSRAPATNRRRALNVALYPLRLWREAKRRWTSRGGQDRSQLFPSRGTEGCNACGRLAKAPEYSTYLPSGDVVYQWRCSECCNSWRTSVYPARRADSQSSQSEHLRENAGRCLTLEDSAPDDATRRQFRRMNASWLALAETQDWLDGAIAPVARPLPQGRIGSISSIPHPRRGNLS